jgi:hypothetical protein
MSKRNTNNKTNKKPSINKEINNNKALNSNYNLIINQNSTFNQDNSINIMLDSNNFSYFQNIYQQNETDPSNQKYTGYQEYQPIQNQNKQNNPNNQNSKSNNNANSNINANNKNITHKKNKKKYESPKNIRSKRKESPKPQKSKKDLISYDQMNQVSTNKIDYRYVKKCPIKDMISSFKNEDNETEVKDKDNQLFWLATYGKLMKTKHLIKIFNYYNNKPFESTNNNYINNLKEKTLIIKDFEIYFYKNSNKPFIRYSKGGTIFTKLYLLTLREISLIFSYINRIEYKINYDRLNYLQRKGTFEVINDNSNGIILPYCLIYCLGKYMNINVYSFSNNIDFNFCLDEISFQKNQRISSYTVLNNNTNNDSNIFSKDNNHHMNNTNIKTFNFKLPNSKKLAKLVKIINLNFPDFSIDDIINYLIPDNKYINAITKINEIKNIFFFKKSNQNKIILSSMVRDTIKGISIQTPKSLISSFCPCESIIENNSYKNSDLFQPTSKKYVLPIKDDYKFQTISTNEKDNNKNNPFIIYVCDNVQKINFSENINANNNINNESYINKIDNSSNYIKTENNQQNANQKLNQIKKNYLNYESNISNDNVINTNKSQNITSQNEQEKNPKRKSLDPKVELKFNKYGNDVSNVFMSGNKKKMRIQRIATDVRARVKSGKFNSLTGVKNCRNKIRGSKAISHTNINIDINEVGTKGNLNKSIESHNNYSAKYRLSRTSDISQRRKQKTKNRDTMPINRINMNKKDVNNPFYNFES